MYRSVKHKVWSTPTRETVLSHGHAYPARLADLGSERRGAISQPTSPLTGQYSLRLPAFPHTLPVDLNQGFRRIKSSSTSESRDLWTSPSPIARTPGKESSSDVSLRKPGSKRGPSCSPASSPQASHVASPSHSPFSSV